jgi:hypothetical protein
LRSGAGDPLLTGELRHGGDATTDPVGSFQDQAAAFRQPLDLPLQPLDVLR